MTIEDRTAFHLLGHPLPALIDLPSTSGDTTDLFLLSLTRPVLLFLYPQTGTYRPLLASLVAHLPPLYRTAPDLAIFALATHTAARQREDAERLGLPFDLLSDRALELTRALEIPTDEDAGEGTVLRRMTLLLRGGQVARVEYPVERPEEAGVSAQRLLVSEEELMREVEERDARDARAQA